MAKATCATDDCDRDATSRGLCKRHYSARWRNGWYCRVEGCTTESLWRGMCAAHFREWEAAPKQLCLADGCAREARARHYCQAHWKNHTGAERTCEECGAAFKAQGKLSRFCGRDCQRQSLRHPFRRAVESGDSAAVLRVARECSEIDPVSACWLWRHGLNNQGYPIVRVPAGVGVLVHRYVMAAVVRRDLGAEPVHHKCAVTRCVNPDHLQLVSVRENTAEMLQRNYYLDRIASLEAALREASPEHPLLS